VRSQPVGSAVVGVASEAPRPARACLDRTAPRSWPPGARAATVARRARAGRGGRVRLRSGLPSRSGDRAVDAVGRAARRRSPLGAARRRRRGGHGEWA
jgi:hypothetical protein